MITRDQDNNITITPDDIPAIAGMLGAYFTHMKDLRAQDKIPGSFRPMIDMIDDAAKRLDKACKSRVE